MKTEDLILRLVESASPVRPLASPFRRWCRWSCSAIAVTALTVVLIGIRLDIESVILDNGFVALAAATLATALGAAAAALVLSVPGAERSATERWAPVVVAAGWGLLLLVSLASGGSPAERLLALPVHLLCVIEIVAMALVPGWILFSMLRSAEPLRLKWSGGLAVLAAVALAAAGTQFLCPIDDSAHQFVGHFAPVGGFSIAGTWIGQHLLRNQPWRSI